MQPLPRRPHTYDTDPLTRARNLYDQAGTDYQQAARDLLSAVILDARADVHEIRCWRYADGAYDIECFDRLMHRVLDETEAADLFASIFGHHAVLADCIAGACLEDEYIYFRAHDPDDKDPEVDPSVYNDLDYTPADEEEFRR